MFTIRYDTTTGTVQHKTSNKRVIERVGRSLVRRADREEAWNIAVLNAAGDDVTFDFACFQN